MGAIGTTLAGKQLLELGNFLLGLLQVGDIGNHGGAPGGGGFRAFLEQML